MPAGVHKGKCIGLWLEPELVARIDRCAAAMRSKSRRTVIEQLVLRGLPALESFYNLPASASPISRKHYRILENDSGGYTIQALNETPADQIPPALLPPARPLPTRRTIRRLKRE